MKLKFLMIGLFGLISASALAQKGQLNDANDAYTQYDAIKSQKVLASKAAQNLIDAKTAIDKASTNEKTATMAETYALKSAIYGALAMSDSIPATSEPKVATAKDNLTKAQAADTKGEFKKLIGDAQLYVAIYYQTIGVKAYQDKKYEAAYTAFDNWAQSSNYKDTTALYYSALAATNQGSSNPKFYQSALTDYTKLLTTNYGTKAKIYGYMSTLYMQTKDTADAIKTIDSGVMKYPANTVLRESQVRIMLQAGRESELTGTFDKAIANDPNNKTLIFYAALAYSTIADKLDNNALKAKDDASKAALTKQSDENYAKAADYYKKCLALDPTYFDATLNLGYVLMKPAIHIYNRAAALPQNATQKQYDDLRLQADAQFDVAYPYLQKAADMNPKSSDALTNLRNYYRGKYDKAHAADNKTKAEDLKKQIDALSGGSH